MESKDKNKKEKLIIIILIILILLTIIFYLLINFFGRIDNNVKMPTGNVDIFDIVFGDISSNKKCNCNKQCECHNINNSSDNSNSNTSNYNPGCPDCGNDPETNESEIIVYDKEKKYSKNTPLNIFTQTSYYVVNDVIAPTSENSYQFVVRNNNNFNIIYDLEISEENKYNINMKFKLKLNGTYVVGDEKTYVSADMLNQYRKTLADKSYDVYTLEWKWIESDNDTKIGTNINSNYKLNLKMSASQY